jgi:hypothetical protein
MVSSRLSDDGAGPSNASLPSPSAASVNLTAGENHRCHGMVSGRLTDDGAGPSNDSPLAQSAASVNFGAGEDSDEDHLFYSISYFAVFCKNHLNFKEIYVVC